MCPCCFFDTAGAIFGSVIGMTVRKNFLRIKCIQ